MSVLDKVNPKNVLPNRDEESRVKKAKQRVETLTKGRYRWEHKWYENISHDDGRHFIYYNKSRNTIVDVPSRQGVAARVNHIGHRKMKDLQNTILMNDPRWKALPEPDGNGVISQQAVLDASKKNYYLKDLFDRKNIQIKEATMVYNALIMPYAGMWWYYDEIKDDIDADTYDAFDLLVPGDLDDVQESPLIVKQFKRQVEEMKANPYYQNTDDLQADNRFAASEMKDRRLQEKYSGGTSDQNDESVICYEMWVKRWLNEDLRKEIIEFDTKNGDFKREKVPQDPEPVLNDLGEPLMHPETGEPLTNELPPIETQHWTETKPDGYPIMHVMTFTKEGKRFHREQYLDFPLYPCAIFAPETGNYLKPAWIERIMSANKSLDVLQSRIEDYANIAGGRLMKKAGTETTRYETEVGIEVEWDGDQAPQWEQAPNLPDALPSQIANLQGDIAQQTVIGGAVANVAHQGRGQGAMESIKSADMASVKTAVDNLAHFMEQSAAIIMALNDYHLTHTKMVYQDNGVGSANPNGSYFKVIGGRASQTKAFKDGYQSADPNQRPVVLSSETKVKVVIDTGVAYTEQAKRDTMFQLAQMGLLPAEVVLEMLNFDNVSDMMAMLRAQQAGSMIDTPDFNAMDDNAKLAALQNVIAKNVSMPVNVNKIGTAKKISKGLNGSAKNS